MLLKLLQMLGKCSFFQEKILTQSLLENLTEEENSNMGLVIHFSWFRLWKCGMLSADHGVTLCITIFLGNLAPWREVNRNIHLILQKVRHELAAIEWSNVTKVIGQSRNIRNINQNMYYHQQISSNIKHIIVMSPILQRALRWPHQICSGTNDIMLS